MEQKLQARLDLFLENTAAVRKAYVWPHVLVKQMAALLYTVDNKRVDLEHIKACYNLIKQGAGIFSSFRGNLSLAIAAMLSLTGNPQTALENTLAVHGMLKKAGFHFSEFLPMAAFEIATKADPREYEAITLRARDMYKGMRRNRWWITGEDDYIYAAMLALSDMSVDTGVAHVEELHNALKPHLRNANSIQALSQVMAVSGAPQDSAARVLALRDATAALGIRMDRQYTLSSLGILALLPGSADEIATDIKDAYEYLRRQKGFGMWSNSKQTLLLLAGALVSSVRAEAATSDLSNSNIATNFNNVIIAEQMAVITACVVASVTATSSSSSSSGG